VAELACGACGRKFVLKPEYAGKTLKCKCGRPIKAPAAVPAGAPAAARQPVAAASAPAPPSSNSGGDDDFSKLFSDAEAEYEMAPPPLPSPKAKPPIAHTAPAAASAGGSTSPMLGYARAAVRPQVDDATRAAVVSDLYIPIALLIVGLVAYLFDAHLQGAKSAVEASLFVFVVCLLNVLLVFAALMVGVKVIGLALGPIGPALLKIAAVAVLPAAAGDLIHWYSGIGLVAWGMTLVMYYVLLYWLFDMDGSEIYIVTSIMWVVQFILGMFIFGLLMSGMGFTAGGGGSRGQAVATSILSGGGTAQEAPDDDKMSPAELDKRCADAIANNTAFESHEWLNPKYTNHHGLGYSQSEVRALADQFALAGAKKTYTAEIEKADGDELCTRLIVEMPDDPKKRANCLGVRDFFEGREDSRDGGGKYINVMVKLKTSGGI
jgi:hypothetical protein